MKINLGQIATGAMRQYLEDDTARIKTEEERRKARKLHSSRMLEIGEQARLRDKNAIDAEKRAALKGSAVDQGDLYANYPFPSEHWDYAKSKGLRKHEINLEVAKLRGKNQINTNRLAYYEEVLGEVISDPRKYEDNPSFITDIVRQMQRELSSGNLTAKRVQNGITVPGVMKLDSFPNLEELVKNYKNYIGEDSNLSNALGSISNYLNPERTLHVDMKNKNIQKLRNRRINSTKTFEKMHRDGYIPLAIQQETDRMIYNYSGGDWMNEDIMKIGESRNSPEYKFGAEALLRTMLNNKDFPKDIRKGEKVEGRLPVISQLDFIAGTLLYSSDYKYSEPGKDGMYRIDNNVISKDVKQEALKQRRFLPDARKVVETSSRLIQLNKKMQDSIKEAGGVSRFKNIQGVRVFDAWLKPLLKYFSTEDELQTIRQSGKLGEFFTDEKLINEGITDPTRRQTLRDSILAADARIGSIEGEFKDQIIQAEVEYAHLKVLLTFTLAKLIQGGTGGRGVSNQDFDAVAKSLRDGSLTTLPTEMVALRAVYNNAKREYVQLYLTRFPSLYSDTDQSGRMLEKVMNMHGALEMQHQERRDTASAGDVFVTDPPEDGVKLNPNRKTNVDTSIIPGEDPKHRHSHTRRGRMEQN
jgi:hypothetical protein